MSRFFDSEVELLCTGCEFTEGPVPMPDGSIVFSDIPASIMYRWQGGEEMAVFRDPSGNSNGLTLDLDNRLIACEHGNRRVSRTRHNGTVETIADRYNGKRLNSPNDVVVRSDGATFFTDPPYGVEEKDRELDVQGVYRIDPDGALALLVDDFSMPNGLAFSPDETILYITDSHKQHIRAFDVSPEGNLSNGRMFVDVTGSPGTCDGMKVDVEGHVITTAVGGAWVVSPGGDVLEKLLVPEVTTNCAFGGPGRKTLFITSGKSLYRVSVKIAGVAVGRPA